MNKKRREIIKENELSIVKNSGHMPAKEGIDIVFQKLDELVKKKNRRFI